MKYNKILQVIEIFPQRFSTDQLGSIMIPYTLKSKILKYSMKIEEFKSTLLNNHSKKNKKLFKRFIRKLFEKIKKETEMQNHQKIMALKRHSKHSKQSINLKNLKLKKIMSSIYRVIKKRIMKEDQLVQENQYDQSEILNKSELEKLKANTRKIFTLIDDSQFKTSKKYLKLKKLLEKYMKEIPGIDYVRLRKGNCLLLFKRLLLEQLELKS